MNWGITPEVYEIVKRAFRREARAPAIRLSWEELDETNRRVGERLNMDPEWVQIILSYGPDHEYQG